MGILEKVQALGLPAHQYVVMGSAVLELKGIRKAGDIDIIVTRELFETLKKSPVWKYDRYIGSLGNVEVESLDNQNGVELYPSIYGGGDINFFLGDPTRFEEIEGIYFVSLSNLLEAKSTTWDREKDRKDAELIREYLATHSQ